MSMKVPAAAKAKDSGAEAEAHAEAAAPASPASPLSASPQEKSVVPACIREAGTPSTKQGCRVHFGVVEWRNHELLLDGSGGLTSSGTGLGIGWKIESALGTDRCVRSRSRPSPKTSRDLYAGWFCTTKGARRSLL